VKKEIKSKKDFLEFIKTQEWKKFSKDKKKSWFLKGQMLPTSVDIKM